MDERCHELCEVQPHGLQQCNVAVVSVLQVLVGTLDELLEHRPNAARLRVVHRAENENLKNSKFILCCHTVNGRSSDPNSTTVHLSWIVDKLRYLLNPQSYLSSLISLG